MTNPGMASAARLFEGCYSLESVEGFEALAPATDFTFIFNSCGRLKSVYAAEGFRLVGGNVTAYDDKRAGADMAVIDEPGQAGYLTAG